MSRRRVSTLAAIALAVVLLSLFACSAWCQDKDKDKDNPGRLIKWQFTTQDDKKFADPSFDDSGWKSVELGYKWKSSGFPWMRARVTIPDVIDGKSTTGEAVGMKFNACDGGECYVNGKLLTRFDNDHPPMIVLSESAKPGETVNVAVRLFMGPDTAEHDGTLGQCDLAIIDKKLMRDAFAVNVDAAKQLGPLPKTFAGFSQGAGLPDYDDSTAALFKDLGIKWFRMDNIFTNMVKKNPDGSIRYDWTDLDTRLDFMKKVNCEFIACISYMPEALDAVVDGERHSYPRDWNEFGDVVYNAVKHCIDHGTPVKYWEVWNEINTGWMVDPKGWDHLRTYITLYDVCWKAVRKADPNAWVGGPCVASGPWDDKDPRGPGTHGEKFMRGLMDHCERTGAPLDFITWHEYFQPYGIMKKEADQIKTYLNDYPSVKRQVKEYAVTEWSYAWWHDRAQDNEVGAAWAAASMLRGWMAAGIQKPCYFLAKDFSSGLSGEWGLFTRENKPKAVANVCRMFNMTAPIRITCSADDDQIASVASVDPKSGRLTVLILNFGERYGAPRKITLSVKNLPKSLKGGTCRQYLMDVTHSNLWNDAADAKLDMVKETPVSASVGFDMANNSVTLLEMAPRPR